MHKICLITCYMGPMPNYFSYFLGSCQKNKDVKFVVVSDSIGKSEVIGNVTLVKLDLQQLGELASTKLKADVKVANAWKINEYKPAFGVIFDNQVQGFDFWGWCDLDIIWGDIRAFMTEELLNEYDVIAPKDHWTAGHFTLLRNTEANNNLFRDNPDVIALFNDETYYAFEECCQRWDGQARTVEVLKKSNLPVSMFDIVKNAEKEGRLKARFKDIIREHPQLINYLYKNGKFTDLSSGEAFMYYHLLTIKKIWRFYIPDYPVFPDSLYATPLGIISAEDKNSFVKHMIWKSKRARSCWKGIRKSIRNKNIFSILKKITTGKF